MHGVDRGTHPVRVVKMQDPTSAAVDLLVALSTPAHAQRRIHVDIVTRQVKADQSLENDTPSREC